MNWLDIILAIVLVVFTFIGLKNGLIRAILSLLGLILGIFLAGRLYTAFAGILTFLPEAAAKVLAYILILLIVLVIMSIVARILDKILHAMMLGWINHISGAVVGLFFGGIFLGAEELTLSATRHWEGFFLTNFRWCFPCYPQSLILSASFSNKKTP